jgi:hypothetical protein
LSFLSTVAFGGAVSVLLSLLLKDREYKIIKIHRNTQKTSSLLLPEAVERIVVQFLIKCEIGDRTWYCCGEERFGGCLCSQTAWI